MMRSLHILMGFAALGLIEACTARASRSTTANAHQVKSDESQRSAVPDETAVVATTQGLYLYNIKSKTSERVMLGEVERCLVDNKAQVVWLIVDEQLRAFDLLDRSAHTLAVGLPAVEEMIVYHGRPAHRVRFDRQQTLYRLDPVDFSIALKIDLADGLKIGAEVGCEGDGAWGCYQEDDDSGNQKLNANLQASVSQLNGTQLRHRDYLQRVYQRGRARTLWSPLVNQKKIIATLKSVPTAHCTEKPEDCGAATAVPGTRYWRVIIENSRGDFFNETTQLYDPRSKMFFDPITQDKATTPLPLNRASGSASGSSFEYAYIAPNASAYSQDGKVVSFEHGVLFEGELSCGWVGGGHYIMGPRDWSDSA